MSEFQSLKITLSQQVSRLFAQYESQPQRKIYADFDRTLFSQGFEQLGFYLAEIRHTLAELNRLDESQTSQSAYLAQKLAAQCTALNEALNRYPARKSYRTPRAEAAPTAQTHPVHRLPPAQRLEKYYQALATLNAKLDSLSALNYDADSESARLAYQQQIEQTQQRRQRCLDAIELLEEYLAWREDTAD